MMKPAAVKWDKPENVEAETVVVDDTIAVIVVLDIEPLVKIAVEHGDKNTEKMILKGIWDYNMGMPLVLVAFLAEYSLGKVENSFLEEVQLSEMD